MSAKNYQQFRETYLLGLARIRAANADIHPRRRNEGDVVHVAVNAALNALRSSPFGEALISDEGFLKVHHTLERSLEGWFAIAYEAELDETEEHGKLDEWVCSTYMRTEREFQYWGRLGGILHHYRDMGQGLGTTDERSSRVRIQSLASDLGRELTDLTDAPVPQALYRADVLQRVNRLRTLLQRVHRDFARTPIRGGEGPSALHQDEKLLRRQFSHVCCLLALELFGHISSETLGQLLELKSSTADELGLEAWPGAISSESASRERRRSIDKALKTAVPMSKRYGWVTRPIVQLFSAHTHNETSDGAAELRPRRQV